MVRGEAGSIGLAISRQARSRPRQPCVFPRQELASLDRKRNPGKTIVKGVSWDIAHDAPHGRASTRRSAMK